MYIYMCVHVYLYKYMLIHKHIWKKKTYCNKKKMPHHTLAGKKIKTLILI